MPFDHFVGRGHAASALSFPRPRASLPFYLSVVVIPLDQTRACSPVSKYPREMNRDRYYDVDNFSVNLHFNLIEFNLFLYIFSGLIINAIDFFNEQLVN